MECQSLICHSLEITYVTLSGTKLHQTYLEVTNIPFNVSLQLQVPIKVAVVFSHCVPLVSSSLWQAVTSS